MFSISSTLQAMNLKREIDLSKWDTSNITQIGYAVFETNIPSVGDTSDWNTLKVDNDRHCFDEAKIKTSKI